jgi:hypothetical protein
MRAMKKIPPKLSSSIKSYPSRITAFVTRQNEQLNYSSNHIQGNSRYHPKKRGFHFWLKNWNAQKQSMHRLCSVELAKLIVSHAKTNSKCRTLPISINLCCQLQLLSLYLNCWIPWISSVISPRLSMLSLGHYKTCHHINANQHCSINSDG